MSKTVALAEKFIWNNLRMYLLTHKTCLLDNLLVVKFPESLVPSVRYGNDFIAEIDKHIGLGSYVNNQPTQFSRLPYITVNITPIAGSRCNTRVVIGFEIVYTTDTPTQAGHKQIPVGNSSESVASFKANIMSALDELMYDATDEIHYGQVSFFDALRGKTITHPFNGQTKKWTYDIWGQVDDRVDVSEVYQLKREDRSSAMSVFSVVYTMDLNRLKGHDVDCGC